MTVNGVDVSSYQSVNFSTKGLGFAFVKATEGISYINPHQNGQAYTARHAGLVLGFYHMLRPGNFDQQAMFFVEKCASVPGDILAVDWEDPKVSCAQKDAFLRSVKKLRPTHKVVLYCNTDYWKHHDTTSFCQDGLWIADYASAAGHPPIQHAWTFHQYSDRNGVDSDVANFANASALRKWAHGA